MSRQVFFVAGTDTGVGKTYVACALLRAAQARGLRTLGLKPLAAGAVNTADGWRNDDALLLQQASSVKIPYHATNPHCFAPAIAPHIAAQQAGIALRAADLAQQIRQTLQDYPCDYAVVEGAGGWRVPLNDSETLADVAKQLQLPVLLVVGMKLGCLNHALLTAEAIARDGLSMAGWVANDMGQPMENLVENISSLESLMFLGHKTPRLALPAH